MIYYVHYTIKTAVPAATSGGVLVSACMSHSGLVSGPFAVPAREHVAQFEVIVFSHSVFLMPKLHNDSASCLRFPVASLTASAQRSSPC